MRGAGRASNHGVTVGFLTSVEPIFIGSYTIFLLLMKNGRDESKCEENSCS
jgi:hypothetical protein